MIYTSITHKETVSNLPKIFLTKRQDGSFLPSFNQDQEKASKIKVGEHIQVNYRKARNPGHNAKYWKTLTIIAEHVEKAKETIHSELKYVLGEYDVTEVDGKTIIIPRSTSFENMDQNQFEDYYSRAVVGLKRLYGDWWMDDDMKSHIDENL